MIYVASPYSHADARVREERFRAVCRFTAELMRGGIAAFSPIAHSHPLVEYGLPQGWEFWERFDTHHIRHAEELIVLMLTGWEDSVGVRAELEIARRLDKPVRYVQPTDETPQDWRARWPNPSSPASTPC